MKLSTFQANHRFLHFIDMSLFVGPSEVPFYGDGVPFYRDLLWFVGPGPPFYRDGVPFYRCPTSSPPGPHVHVSVYGTVCVYVYVQYMLCIGMCVHVLGSWFYSKRVLSVLFCFRPAQQNMNWSWGIVVSSPCCLQCCHSVQQNAQRRIWSCSDTQGVWNGWCELMGSSFPTCHICWLRLRFEDLLVWSFHVCCNPECYIHTWIL